MTTDDRQVRQFLLQFTLLPVSEIEALVAEHLKSPQARAAQRVLAREVTTLVHSAEEAADAEAASAILFGAPLGDAGPRALAAVAREVSSLDVTRETLTAGVDLAELLATNGLLAASKGEARRAVSQGGIYVNGDRAVEGQLVGQDDLLADRYVLLRKGKKDFAMVVVRP